MQEQDLRWTKVELFEALRIYQSGLAELQEHVDELKRSLGDALTPELSRFTDRFVGTIVNTTVDVADLLDE
jgi:hypothetical protein